MICLKYKTARCFLSLAGSDSLQLGAHLLSHRIHEHIHAWFYSERQTDKEFFINDIYKEQLTRSGDTICNNQTTIYYIIYNNIIYDQVQ